MNGCGHTLLMVVVAEQELHWLDYRPTSNHSSNHCFHSFEGTIFRLEFARLIRVCRFTINIIESIAGYHLPSPDWLHWQTIQIVALKNLDTLKRKKIESGHLSFACEAITWTSFIGQCYLLSSGTRRTELSQPLNSWPMMMMVARQSVSVMATLARHTHPLSGRVHEYSY